ncbi:MAG: tRNA (guanosine(37)-N1)-methyltransferase TrmD [Pseudomonadota bacterium]
MRIDLLSLFPDMFDAVLDASILGRARRAGLVDLRCTDIRLFTDDRHHTVDDTPYGGGAGMVLKIEPALTAIEAVVGDEGGPPDGRVIALMSASGHRFEQAAARELSLTRHLVLLCGRYEGVDARLAAYVDRELSIGDYVLTGGELAAMVVVDAVVRLLPGALGNDQSAVHESHTGYRLEHPHYTRPPVHLGEAVPEVLLSGDHRRIAQWRQAQSLHRTREARPDLLRDHPLTSDEIALLCGREPRRGRR